MWTAVVGIIIAGIIASALYYVRLERRRTQEKAKLYDRAYYTVARFSSRNPRKKGSL